MRDFLPGEVQARTEVLAAVQSVFQSYGFSPLETPALERLEILQGKYGEEGDRLIFKVAQRGARTGEDPDLALRYDLTVPLARVVAEYGDQLGKIFKRYQIAPVWRADRPGRGRYREFRQCDIDVVGPSFGLADAEVIQVVTDALAAVGLHGFEVRLNSRKVLRGLMEAFAIAPEAEAGVLTALDKVDKVGWDGVAAELVGERGLAPAAAGELTGAARDVDEVRRLLAERSAVGEEGLAEVDAIAEALPGRTVFTPHLARGLAYYTGPIFETYVSGFPSAIASGGRYDGLVGMFAGRPIPAVGGSLGIERILLLVAGEPEALTSPARVLVTVWDAAARPGALGLAADLRAAGIATEVYLGGERMGEQLGYASSRAIPFAVIQGPRERERGVVAVRDLGTRTQAEMGLGDLAGYLAT